MNGKPLHRYSEPTQVALLKRQIAGVEAARVAAVELATAETVRADRAEQEIRSLTLELKKIRKQLVDFQGALASAKRFAESEVESRGDQDDSYEVSAVQTLSTIIAALPGDFGRTAPNGRAG